MGQETLVQVKKKKLLKISLVDCFTVSLVLIYRLYAQLEQNALINLESI